jgi:CheY-like chemotaxis protein
MTGSDSLSGRKILIAEDEYFIMDDMVRAFVACGVDIVGPAATVEEALDLVANAGDLDAAVLDINLQGEMAYPVADALRARSVPFLFATGYDDGTLPARYSDVKRCEKPVEPADLIEELRTAL